MILEQVLQRRLQAISMDDTLKVAVQKLRELDRVNSPIIAYSEGQDFDETVEILVPDEYPGIFLRAHDQVIVPQLESSLGIS